MKNVFTYPDNLATDYINPIYLGDNDSGFFKRTKALLNGTYKAYLNDLGTVPGTADINTTIQKMSSYHDAFLEQWGENTIYQYWNQPLIEAELGRISVNITSATNAVSPTPITFTVPATPALLDGELVDASNFDSTLISLNSNAYFVKVLTSTTVQLSTNSALTELLKYTVQDLEDITLVTGATTTNWNPAVLTSVGFSTSGLAFLNNFDGTMAKYNGEKLYVSAIDADTFNLSWNSGGTDLLKFEAAGTTTAKDYSIAKYNVTASAGTPTTGGTAVANAFAGLSWDPVYKVDITNNASPNAYSGFKGATLDVTLDSVALVNGTASAENTANFNEYKIRTMSEDGGVFVYTSETAADQIMEWTGDEYVVSDRFTWAGASDPKNRFYGTGLDARFFWFDNTVGLKPTTPGFFSATVHDLQGVLSDTTFNATNQTVLANPTTTASTARPQDGIKDVAVMAFSPQNGYNACLGDPGHTYDSNGRVFVIGPYETTSPTAHCSVKAVVPNPVTSNTATARFGEMVSVANNNTMMVSNFAKANRYFTGTRYEFFYLNSQLSEYNNGENNDVTHFTTIVQNLNTRLDLFASVFDTDPLAPGAGTPFQVEHPIAPKMSADGSVFVIAGQISTRLDTQYEPNANSTGGFQVYRFNGTTWETRDTDEIECSRLSNFEVHDNGNTITIQHFLAPAVSVFTYNTVTERWLETASYYNDPYFNMNFIDNQPATFGCATKSFVAGKNPTYNGHVFSRGNLAYPQTSTDSSIRYNRESTGGLISWYLANSNTFITPTVDATKFIVNADKMLTTTNNITHLLGTMQQINGSDANGEGICKIGEAGATLTNSTTGKFAETAIENNNIIVETPAVVTKGTLKVSLTESLPYIFSGVNMFNSGNQKYRHQTGESTFTNGAIVLADRWIPGATSPSVLPALYPSFTVQQDASGYITGVTPINPPSTRYAVSDVSMLTIGRLADTYVAPPLTPSQQADVFDTDDEWLSAGFSQRKTWPTTVTPTDAQINYNTPTIVNNSQSGVKYTRSSGHTKWTLDVNYPAMTAEEFKDFHAISQAANGQAIPFYFILQDSGGGDILWKTSYTGGTTKTPRVKDAVLGGDTTVLLEGFRGTEFNAFTRGEVFIDGANENGNLHTSLNTAIANVFGEVKIRVPLPFRKPQEVGQLMFKDPYHAVVTLGNDSFAYTVDVNGYYYLSVMFDLDGFK